MLRRAEQLFARCLFDDATALHDTYAMRNSLHKVQIVADQQQRHAQAGLQFLEQFEDFQLNGHVQRGGRLVGDQQFRLVGQGHGDHHPLTLAAGQFVGQGLEALVRLGDADHLQQFQGAFGRDLAAQALVDAQHLVDLLFDRVQRIERGHRLLEDHRNPVAANVANGFFFQVQQVLPGIFDGAGRMPREGVGQQAQDRMCGDRFTGTALADQGQGFTALDVEADAFDRPLAAIADDKLDGQVAHFDQIVLIHFTSSGRRHRERTRR
ncbi:hypothetical protein D3C85_496580 [compost metagenome]